MPSQKQVSSGNGDVEADAADPEASSNGPFVPHSKTPTTHTRMGFTRELSTAQATLPVQWW
eukprot:scaffold281_cov318-Pavlova_lutheri.AAC.14